MPDGIIMVLVIAVLIIIFLAVFLTFVPLGLWITAIASGAHVRISTLIGMRLRHISPARIVRPYIQATKAGLDVSMSEMETLLLAGGNVDRVINALIAAQAAQIPLEFVSSRAIDLAGRDVLQAVQMSVNPKVIETPVVAAIAKDGIELRAKARVTVRANIERLVGGAGEETIIARVGEGIVTTVGIDHEAYLGNTRDAIGWEKAHIYRKGHPAVCADPNPPRKLVQYAQALSADLILRGKDFEIEELPEGLMRFQMQGQVWTLPVPALAGANQIDNAAGVLAIVASLLSKLPVSEEQIAEGLRSVRVSARFEKVQSDPDVILDVGHNPHAANVLAQNVRALQTQGKVIAVFGMLADKDMLDVVKIMSPVISEWFITGLPGPRGASAEELRRVMLEAGVDGTNIHVCDGVADAFARAKREAAITDKILIFGSFVTVTAALPLVR